jgi:ABC-2 type transport system ATP-binding protein
VIEITGLRKTFRSGRGKRATVVEAVRGVDLTVHEGEIFGFLGPNGAGKTTTLQMLTTLLSPDRGTVTIAGVDLLDNPEEVRRRVGYVAQGGGTWGDVTGREELVMQARMYGFGREEARRRAEAALAALDMSEFADRKCKTYSGGQRRRIDIAMGVIHEPRVLFLDEPTAGLDPQSRARVWEKIRSLHANGMTVFLTTHYLDEADELCDRIAIIDEGTIVTGGTPEQLKREITGDVVTVGVNGATRSAADLLDGQAYVRKLESIDDGGLRLHVEDGSTAIPQIMRTLESARLDLDSIQLHRPSLDEVFLAKTGRSLRES